MQTRKWRRITKRLFIGLSFIAALSLVSAAAQGQAVKRIEFAKGKSSTIVRGATGQNGTSYVLRARSGQMLELTLSPHRGLGIKVEGKGRYGHVVLLREERGGRFEVGLEESGDYTIFIGSTSLKASTFTLGIRIRQMTDI